MAPQVYISATENGKIADEKTVWINDGDKLVLRVALAPLATSSPLSASPSAMPVIVLRV